MVSVGDNGSVGGTVGSGQPSQCSTRRMWQAGSGTHGRSEADNSGGGRTSPAAHRRHHIRKIFQRTEAIAGRPATKRPSGSCDRRSGNFGRGAKVRTPSGVIERGKLVGCERRGQHVRGNPTRRRSTQPCSGMSGRTHGSRCRRRRHGRLGSRRRRPGTPHGRSGIRCRRRPHGMLGSRCRRWRHGRLGSRGRQRRNGGLGIRCRRWRYGRHGTADGGSGHGKLQATELQKQRQQEQPRKQLEQ